MCIRDRSKIAAENYILSRQPAIYNKLTTLNPQSKLTFILRPCMIHGPGNKGNLNSLFKVVKSGIPWPLGLFENKRSFTSIDNLTFILSEIIEKEIESGIYNVGDDEPVSTNELIAIIAETLHFPVRIWKLNAKIIRFFALAGTKLHLPLNEERLKKLTENYVVSNSKLKNALGIKKMPVRAQDGLKKTIKNFDTI
jgi:nucleoside-diphosphate-sugar epimerase